MFMLLFTACEQTLENENINLSKTNIKGNWTVNAYVDNELVFGPFTVSTEQTSENESIYIKDNGEFWNFQLKAELENSKDTFKANSSVNEISSVGAKIKVLNGTIINKDSIAFDILFEDDEIPFGVTYKIMGHQK